MAAADEIALTLLRREGPGCIWELHVRASRMYREGIRDAAEWMVKIADVAEDMHRRRQVRHSSSGTAGSTGEVAD